MTDLRPYQADVIEKCRAAVAAGKRRILLVCPTGGGKTVIAASIAAGVAGEEKARPVLRAPKGIGEAIGGQALRPWR